MHAHRPVYCARMPPSRARSVASLGVLAAALGGCGGSSSSAPTSVPAPAPTGPPAPGNPVISDGVAIGQTEPALLTIGYVERLPRMDYVWESPSPATDGWPVEGQAVTWRAHLRNWSSS